MESKRDASEVVDKISDEILKGLVDGSTKEYCLTFEHEVLGKLYLRIFEEKEEEIIKIMIKTKDYYCVEFHIEEGNEGWTIIHRYVQQNLQRNGLGTLCMLLIEKMVGLSKNKVLIAGVVEMPICGGKYGEDWIASYGIQVDYLELVLSNGSIRL